MPHVPEKIKAEVDKTVREKFEGWIARRHWFWLVLILVVTGGYVEVPNLPIVLDDVMSGFIAATTAFELWRRAKEKWIATFNPTDRSE